MKLLVTLAMLLSASAFAADTLHIYTWADYISADLVKRFEKEQNCKVVIDTFDANETMFAKLKAGATGYDLIFPTSYMVKVMNDQGMLQAVDHSQLPNAKNVDPEGYTLYTYAAMQVWTQAVAKAKTTDPKKVMETIKGGEWDTVLGKLGFDAKGDIKVIDYVVYKWDAKGNYAEINPKGS